jgi:hypothetical protein
MGMLGESPAHEFERCFLSKIFEQLNATVAAR